VFESAYLITLDFLACLPAGRQVYQFHHIRMN